MTSEVKQLDSRVTYFHVCLSYPHSLWCHSAKSHHGKGLRTERQWADMWVQLRPPDDVNKNTEQRTIQTQHRCVADVGKCNIYTPFMQLMRTENKSICFGQLESHQVLQPTVIVSPWGTVTGVGGDPEACCCRKMQPHSWAGTQLLFSWSRPWREITWPSVTFLLKLLHRVHSSCIYTAGATGQKTQHSVYCVWVVILKTFSDMNES